MFKKQHGFNTALLKSCSVQFYFIRLVMIAFSTGFEREDFEIWKVFDWFLSHRPGNPALELISNASL